MWPTAPPTSPTLTAMAAGVVRSTTKVKLIGATHAEIGVPVTVYVVVVDGFAITLGPVDGVIPVVGLHVHV